MGGGGWDVYVVLANLSDVEITFMMLIFPDATARVTFLPLFTQ